jgi:uncharacterized protein involved in outer membrane biogenesis
MQSRRIVSAVFKILGITIGSLLIMGVFIGIFYEKEVKQLIITELNKRLDTKVAIKEFDFSVIRHFPYASFDLNDVVIDEVTNSPKKDTLLYSKKITLLFNVMGLFSKDVSVKKILVYDGFANIKIDKEGAGNYHFWKKPADSTSSSALDLQKIGLKNVYLRYVDLKSDEKYGLKANSTVLAVKIQGDEFNLNTKGDIFVDYIIVGGRNYVDHKKVVVNSQLAVNTKKGTYKFDNNTVNIQGVDFYVSGLLTDEPQALLLDLAVKSNSCELKKLLAVLPAELVDPVKKYNGSGEFVFNSHISGNIDHRKNPNVNVEFTLKDGAIQTDDAGLDKINLSGKYTYTGKTKKAMLDIPSLTAFLSGHKIQASIRLDDIPDAFLTLHAKTQLDLKELRPLLNADTLESLSGDMAMNIHYAGKVRELSNVRRGQLYNITASGDVDLQNVNFTLKNNPLVFTNMSGNFSLNDNDVYIKNFTGKISSTDFRMNGVFRNFISFLLIPDQPGELEATFNSSLVDLDELLVNKSTASEGDTSYLMKFNPRLVCKLDVGVGRLAFRRFTAEKISGRVNLNKQVISGEDMQFVSMGGNVSMDAMINASRRDSISMTYDAKFTGVDITRLFYEMENFDQQTMTDKNLKGRLTADVQFKSQWSKDLIINSRSVKSTASIVIDNGELNNFQPIRALGKYIHVSDLDHIRFSTLKNTISIADRKIYIPHMDINSSALNISGNGTHDFDNFVDYHVVMLLSDVLGKKVKSNTSEFGEIEDDGLGHSKLYLSMKGPVMDPSFAYDRKAVGQKIKNDIAVEKQNLKGILKQEFGLYKNQQSVQAPKPKKKEEMQIDWSGQE